MNALRRVAILAAAASVATVLSACMHGSGTGSAGVSVVHTAGITQSALPGSGPGAGSSRAEASNLACAVMNTSGAKSLVSQSSSVHSEEHSLGSSVQYQAFSGGSDCMFGFTDTDNVRVLVFHVKSWDQTGFKNSLGNLEKLISYGNDGTPVVSKLSLNNEDAWLVTPTNKSGHGYTDMTFKVKGGTYVVHLGTSTVQSRAAMLNVANQAYNYLLRTATKSGN